MSLFTDIIGDIEKFRGASPTTKLIIFSSLILSSTALLKISDAIVEWHGFISEFLNIYHTYITNNLAGVINQVFGTDLSVEEIDWLSAVFFAINLAILSDPYARDNKIKDRIFLYVIRFLLMLILSMLGVVVLFIFLVTIFSDIRVAFSVSSLLIIVFLPFVYYLTFIVFFSYLLLFFVPIGVFAIVSRQASWKELISELSEMLQFLKSFFTEQNILNVRQYYICLILAGLLVVIVYEITNGALKII